MHRILIAEDEPRITAFIEKGLRKQGFTTAISNDGETALQMALTGNFDLMLLDLGLPGMDGSVVLEEIRRQGNQLLIIIVTARDGVNDRVESLSHGANDYITKPFKFKDLLKSIQAHLDE
ncbi:MAG: response regulator [Pseudanabaenales cyanobacterium]|nr:response regulator [Pseudanabaenales cyanobacterium]